MKQIYLKSFASCFFTKFHACRRLEVWMIALGLVLMAEEEVYAYVDPGTGSLVWQTLAAGLVGVLFYLRKLWSLLRIRGKDDKS
jgi:hypothetical protein